MNCSEFFYRVLAIYLYSFRTIFTLTPWILLIYMSNSISPFKLLEIHVHFCFVSFLNSGPNFSPRSSVSPLCLPYQINACAHCFRGAYGFYSVFVFQKPKLLGDSYSLLEIAGKCTELSLLQTRGGPCRQKEGTFSAATRRADDPGYRRADGFLCLSILHHRSYPSCPGSEAKTRGIADGGKLSETKFLPPHLNGA